MTKIKSTKRALIVSALALVVCVSMLVGSTFAWFTDSVTSTGNKIVSGNLDVDLYMWNSDTDSTEITDASAPIFGSAALAQNDEQTLWEPGKTQVAYLSIKNNGSLDLKYKVAVNVKNAKNDLFEVMEYAITPDAKFGTVDAWDAANGKKVELGVNATDAVDVALKAGEEHFFALSVHMQETAGNKYMNGEVDFDIQVLAGQLASEFDSFDNTYDTLASYAGTGFAAVVAGEAIEVQIKGTDDYKVGSAIIPANAIAAGTSSVAVTVVDTVYNGNFTVSANETAKSYDVTVTGLKENNTEPVKVQIRIPADLDPNTVKLYHYDTELTCTYNPNTGYVTFETATFSPFTIVYEAGSSYVPPVADEKALPTATVTELSSDKYQNIDWGNYDQCSPTAGL